MAEKGGLFGWLFGSRRPSTPQDPTPNQLMLQEVQSAQQKQEREQKAITYGEMLKQATNITIPDIPEDGIDYQAEIGKIDQSVIGLEMYGKFRQMSIKGQPLPPNAGRYELFSTWGDEDHVPFSFSDYYSDRTSFLDPIRVIQGFLDMSYRNQRIQTPSQRIGALNERHFISAVNVPSSHDAVISYFCSYLAYDSAGRRASSPGSINFRMPAENAQRLLGLIKKNPDIAEMFLQTAAAGFEEGVRRIKSDEIVIVNLKDFDLRNFNRYLIPPEIDNQIHGASHLGGHRFSEIGRDVRDNPDNLMERHAYTKPYGQIEPQELY